MQRATHVTLDAWAREVADVSLTASELNVMASLADKQPPSTLTELAACVGSRPTTVSGVLDRLERRGLVRRRPDPTDRRALRLQLTEDGAAAATRVRQALDDLEARLLGGLSSRTVAEFRRALAALTKGPGDG
jgi:DNA-binding MarR family transcriptional regulator